MSMAAAAAQYRRMAATGTDQMAGAGSLITKGTNGVVQFYYAWAIEAAVISSFILQLFLILFAGIRRRHASRGVFRGIIWVPYQLAVFTTTFGLGYLSISSRPPDRQQLVALWAPLLLLHVGGPDSITAYASTITGSGSIRFSSSSRRSSAPPPSSTKHSPPPAGRCSRRHG